MNDFVTDDMYKILRHLYKRPDCMDVYENLPKPLKHPSKRALITQMCFSGFIGRREPEGGPFYSHVTEDHDGKIFYLFTKGVVYVENRITAFRTWFIPVSISLFSVACSIAAIIISAIK